MKLQQGRVVVGIMKRFFTREWEELEQAPNGSGHSLKLTEFWEHLDNALRDKV